MSGKPRDRTICTDAPTGGGGSSTYSYDTLGRRTTATGDLGTTAYTYDAASKLTAATGMLGTTTYSYDPAGGRTTETANGAAATTYAYAPAGRLTTLTDLGGEEVVAHSRHDDGDDTLTRHTTTTIAGQPAADTRLAWDTQQPIPTLVELDHDTAGSFTIIGNRHHAVAVDTTGVHPTTPSSPDRPASTPTASPRPALEDISILATPRRLCRLGARVHPWARRVNAAGCQVARYGPSAGHNDYYTPRSVSLRSIASVVTGQIRSRNGYWGY